MNANKGSVLILTMIMMTTAAVLTLAYLSMVRHDNILTNSRANEAHALYIAEAGLNKAAWYLLNTAPDNTTDGSWRTPSYTELFGGGSYTIGVQNSGGAILITSDGIYNGSTYMVHQQENMVTNPPNSRTLTAVAGSWGGN